MSKLYTRLHQFRDRLNKLTARFKHSRLEIPLATLNEFVSQEDQDAFIKKQLENNGFDLTRPVSIYNGITRSVQLYEQ